MFWDKVVSAAVSGALLTGLLYLGAFMIVVAVGMLVAGAGFAILENMLYQGLYAQWSGSSWGGITLLRGFGSVLHPLCTGIVVLGWYRSGNRNFSLRIEHTNRANFLSDIAKGLFTNNF